MLPEEDFADRLDFRTEARGDEGARERRALSARVEGWLWIAQRASATVLALCVAVHLATIIYAVQGGLSAAEILGRTRGNAGWLAFYVLFVAAVAVHAPIGLRAVLREWIGWRDASRDVFLAFFSGALLFIGLRAALAVFA